MRSRSSTSRSGARSGRPIRASQAVELLRIEVSTNKIAPLFRPNLPWFRSLEGHPGYDALVRQKAERLAKYRAEMMAVEAELATSP
jgi:hypothetical protein